MPNYGIDTSIFVRLITRIPEKDFEKTLTSLKSLLARQIDVRFFVSNIVIGEAYFVLQHHYNIEPQRAREAMVSALQSGLIEPLHGSETIKILQTQSGAGLMDRLIAEDYHAYNITTLTHDIPMSSLPHCEKLK